MNRRSRACLQSVDPRARIALGQREAPPFGAPGSSGDRVDNQNAGYALCILGATCGKCARACGDGRSIHMQRFRNVCAHPPWQFKHRDQLQFPCPQTMNRGACQGCGPPQARAPDRRMDAPGTPLRNESSSGTPAQDAGKAHDMKCRALEHEPERSCCAGRPGIGNGGVDPASHEVDGAVDGTPDAKSLAGKPPAREERVGWPIPASRRTVRNALHGRSRQ